MNIIKWGIIGPGNIANSFAKGFEHLSNTELYGVASRDVNRAKLFAKKYNIRHVYNSYIEMLADPNIDVVYISTINTTHKELIIESLNAGKSVLCEKPIVMKKEEVLEVFKLAKDKNLFIMEAFWTKFLPGFIKMKEWISSGQIGDLKKLSLQFTFNVPFDPNNRLFNPDVGGGALYDIGIYGIGFALDIMGEKPIDIISSVSKCETGVDTSTTLILKFKGGKDAVLQFSFEYNSPNTAYIYGSKGYIQMDDFWCVSNIYLYKDDNLIESLEKSKDGTGYQYEVKEVVECLNKGKLISDKMSDIDSYNIASIIDEVLQK